MLAGIADVYGAGLALGGFFAIVAASIDRRARIVLGYLAGSLFDDAVFVADFLYFYWHWLFLDYKFFGFVFGHHSSSSSQSQDLSGQKYH